MMKPVAAVKAEPDRVEGKAVSEGKNDTNKTAGEKTTPPKPKSAGKLDWSKAKTKIKAEESQAKVKFEEGQPKVEKSSEEDVKPSEKPTMAKAGVPTMKDFFAKKASNKSKEPPPAQVKKEIKLEKTLECIPSEPPVKVRIHS